MVVLIRGKSLKAGPALVAILFGFFLASTGIAPSINRFLNSVAETINNISF
ncbi:membrane protein [Streptomyces rimosus subsp. rimosus]|nr:membrane protein [Streptomyces sp. NRRL WC-3701]KOT45250.1 membrane protein [Streptomyces rimosus subsp. rimosus]KOT82605.1 membrane protein [Streptomyces rimosus subsp. pseudoverticillatus]KOT97548.1 membrane protein [Streptomyces sp. NRRL F-5755]KOT56049.1 membrane protein [Streptomyces rimosus subsp. rimosus]